MRPSEKRALQEEKRRSLQEAKNAESDISAPKVTAPEVTAYEMASDRKTVYKRKEGFFQSHVRLITFLIVGTLVLGGFVFGIDMFVASRNNKTVDNMKDMDIETVFAVYDNADIIEWKSFRNFNYTDYSYEAKKGKYFVREYPISDSRLVLKVGGSSLDPHPDYAQLIDYRSGAHIDVFKEDPRDFIKEIEE